MKFILLDIVVYLQFKTLFEGFHDSLWFFMLLFLRLKEVKKKEEVRKQEIKKGKMGAGGLVSANQRSCIPFVPPLRFKYIIWLR